MIWADAISIDQSNVVERGDQVDMMGLIFSKAQHVLVWLGENPEINIETFRLMKEVNQYYEAENERIRSSCDFMPNTDPYVTLLAISDPPPDAEWARS